MSKSSLACLVLLIFTVVYVTGSEMFYRIDYTESALEDIGYFKKHERIVIVTTIDQQLLYQPLIQVRNRKPLNLNDLGKWELRVGKYRIFYDVEARDMLVIVKAVGWKDQNTLYIRGKEYEI